ncbi:MAG: HAD-IIB family hydrolase [Clostridia bacterium]|nr:HAD-IIB family hydrolase [Clostridia bacterium]
MKKIIASDYDRTFYINDEDIEKNKMAVDKFIKLGNKFIIATGRSYYDLMKKVNQYNLIYDYSIINHGATILNKKNDIIFNVSINNNIINELKNELELEKSTEWFCCSKLESRVDFEHTNLTKINVKYPTKKKSLEMNEKINSKFSQYIISYNITSSSIEIVSNKVNKSKSIKMLAEKLGVEKNNIYTIGDGYSDIQMIKDFNGYCMEESVEELKEIALEELPSVSKLVEKVLNKN